MEIALCMQGMECTICKFPQTRCSGYVADGERRLCIHCKRRVERALRAIPGVSAQMDLMTGEVRIRTPEWIPEEALADAAAQGGCTVKSISRLI